MKSSVIFENDEWRFILRDMDSNDLYPTNAIPRGEVVEVPTDVVERQAFFDRYPTVYDFDKDSVKTVFRYWQFQVGLYGNSYYQDPIDGKVVTGNWSGKQIGTLLPNYSISRITKHEPCAWVCCAHKEHALFWERKSLCLDAGETRTITPATMGPAVRTRILLIDGELEINSTVYTGPTVVSIAEDVSIKANSNIRAALAWV